MSEDIKIKHGSLQELKNIEIDDGVIYFAKDDNFLNGKIYYDNPSGEGRINVSGVGYDISGQTIDGYIAGLGAEIFNDYSKREYVEDNYGNVTTFQGNIASGDYSHAEGYATTASESCAHAEGWSTITSGQAAHAEGYNTKASGDYSHTEGYNVKALGEASHAEGHLTQSAGNYSHAEGEFTIAIGKGSHAEGTTDSIIKYVVKITTSTVDNEYIIEGISYDELSLDQYVMIDSNISKIMSKRTFREDVFITTEKPLSTTPLTNADAVIGSVGSIGDYSHTEGQNTTASGYASHAGGIGTIAGGQGQTTIGKYNKKDSSNEYAFIIGNGTSDTSRSNAFAVGWDGDVYIKQTSLIDLIYPVGSIYMSVNNINPSIWLGGTWSAWGSGKVPIGVSLGDSDFGTVEQEGGNKNHTLTTAQIPSHTHSLNNHTHSIPSLTGTAASNGNHTHYNHMYKGGSSGSARWVNSSEENSTADWTSIPSAGAHTHSVSTNASTTGKSSGNTGATGSGSSFSLLQPYITCYMWKRTA